MSSASCSDGANQQTRDGSCHAGAFMHAAAETVVFACVERAPMMTAPQPLTLHKNGPFCRMLSLAVVFLARGVPCDTGRGWAS